MLFPLPSSRRYTFGKVFLGVFLAAFFTTVLSYVLKVAVGDRFNWVAYREYLVNQSIGIVATTVFYFFILNWFHHLFQTRKSWYTFMLPCLAGLATVCLYNLVVDQYLPLSSNIDDPLPLGTLIFGYVLLGLSMLGLGILIAYVNNLRDERKKHKLLQEQKLQLEVEKMEADLNFLKSQINPHFLHNTLNSFYARSLPLSKDLAEGILTLSEIMRYALGEASTVDGKVTVKDEIEHVRNVIKLNQFRFRNNLGIELEVKGVVNGAVIIPFVLITLVENIFKHGDLSDTEHPIRITIELNDGTLRYFSRNKKKQGPKELSTGIGLDNIKKRLQLVYGDRHRLMITDQEHLYTTELIINKL
jgi:hypothetical protein